MKNYLETVTVAEIVEDVLGVAALFALPFVVCYAGAIIHALF